MAKAYLTASKRIGSVGGETYSVVKGQTIVRAKPVSVANPRSPKQIWNRSGFITAVEFFKHGVQNLFKFAFEDKKSFESDYNAFMRNNAKLGIHVTPELREDLRFPMIGNWMLSKGSLVQPSYSIDANGQVHFAVKGYTPSANATIGQLSNAVLAQYPDLRTGDIVTFLYIYSECIGLKTTAVAQYQNDDAKTPQWHIIQFRIDPSSTDKISDALPGSAPAEGTAADFCFWEDTTDATATGCAVIFSRESDGGLKVSTSIIANGPETLNMMENAGTIQYYRSVLAAWRAADASILQGSIADSE